VTLLSKYVIDCLAGDQRHAHPDFPFRLVTLLIFGVCVTAPAPGYTPKPPPDPEAPPPDGPHLLNLRYDENYSFLDDKPEARGDDPLMKLKNIRLSDAWRLDIGGEFRLRAEFRENPTFGLDRRTANAQQNYRWMLHANVKYHDLFRLFAQGVFAHVEDQDGPFQPTQENHGDVHQLFADLRILGRETPLTLRLGRQEFSYGNDRVVGPLDWVSTRRRFDAIKLLYDGGIFDAALFYARPVTVRRTRLDPWNDDYNLYGVYTTYKGVPNHGLDVYALISDHNEETRSPNRKSGALSLYTLGTRFWGRSAGFDYDTELAGQWGRWAGDNVAAWMWEIDGGYTFKHPWKPRIGAGFSYTSGDHDPFDGKVNTFNQLFTFNDVCIGILDLIGRQNLTRGYVTVDLWPIPDKLMVAVYLHRYWLSAAEDAYYNAGAVPILRDLYGSSGVELGTELDLWIEWHLNRHASVAVGYSHFWDDNYVHTRVGTVTGDDDPNLLLLQFRYRF